MSTSGLFDQEPLAPRPEFRFVIDQSTPISGGNSMGFSIGERKLSLVFGQRARGRLVISRSHQTDHEVEPKWRRSAI
jgi:hypothetical protein